MELQLLQQILGKLDKLEADMNDLKAGQQEMRYDIRALKAGQDKLEADVADMKADITHMKTDVADLKADNASLKEDTVLIPLIQQAVIELSHGEQKMQERFEDWDPPKR